MMRKWLVGVTLAVVTILASGMSTVAKDGAKVPRFEVDPSWPKLPNNWVVGEVGSVAVGPRDHVWILHRPGTVVAEQKANAAPPVLEFDAAGKFVRGWGGPATAYEWPSIEHGIHVDYKGNVWITGNCPTAAKPPTPASDDMLLKFTNDGKFLMQIGRRDQSGGNKDTKNVKRATEVVVFEKTNEAFVSDGYGNRRVVVFDADTGAFKRMWGAFGNEPLDPPPAPARSSGPSSPASPAAGTPTTTRAADEGPGPQQFGTVHGIRISNDRLVYVADRNNRRIQIFTLDGKYQKQVFINRNGGATMTVATVAFSPDVRQQFLYAPDYGNSQVVMLDRATLEVVGSFGSLGKKPGEFTNLHHLVVDSKGNIYTAEVGEGRRAQRFAFKGVVPATSTQ
jgi:DNA-binding beta-propeller fold protein YncE